jgi:hypothetical protein
MSNEISAHVKGFVIQELYAVKVRTYSFEAECGRVTSRSTVTTLSEINKIFVCGLFYSSFFFFLFHLFLGHLVSNGSGRSHCRPPRFHPLCCFGRVVSLAVAAVGLAPPASLLLGSRH